MKTTCCIPLMLCFWFLYTFFISRCSSLFLVKFTICRLESTLQIMDKRYYFAIPHDCNFFPYRHPSICIWECCMLMALFRSSGLFVSYRHDHVQRPRFAQDKYTCKHTLFWSYAELCMFYPPPGLSFFSQRAIQPFSSYSLCLLSSPPP